MKIKCPECRGCFTHKPCPTCDGAGHVDRPLTRREQFAMAAMQGLLANPNPGFGSTTLMASAAVANADALVAALEKEKP